VGKADVTLLHHEALLEVLNEEVDFGKRLVVAPLLDEEQVGEASIDLRLGTDFLLLRRTVQPGVDVGDPHLHAQLEGLYERVAVPLGEGLWLHPQQFVLGSTLEFLRLPPTLGAYILGRSSWGRVGLLVATAVVVQPGFAGALTLELVNAGDSPIKLYPGLKIAQLTVHSLTDKTTFAKKPTYSAPTRPQAARLGKDQAELEKIRKLGKALTTTG
jgi:dCTP deaminase